MASCNSGPTLNNQPNEPRGARLELPPAGLSPSRGTDSPTATQDVPTVLPATYGSLVPKGVLASDGGSTVSLRTVLAPAGG